MYIEKYIFKTPANMSINKIPLPSKNIQKGLVIADNNTLYLRLIHNKDERG